MELMQSAGNWVASNAGWLIVIGLAWLVWALLTRYGKGVLFTLAFIFIVIPLVVRFAPGLWTRSGINGSSESQNALCQAYGGDFCKSSYQATSDEQPVVQAIQGASQAVQNVQAALQAQDPKPVKVLRLDALQIWISTLNPRPADWLKNASTAMLPQGVRCDVAGTGEGNKKDEVYDWVCYSTDPTLPLSPAGFQANGYFTRDDKSWGIDRAGAAYGTGDWAACQSCWMVIEPTAVPTQVIPTERPPQPTPAPLSGEALPETSDKTVTVLDPTGADWYTPVGGSCIGITFKKVGVIPFGAEVQVVQVFSGAGRIVYRGTQDLGLTSDQKCIYMGTLNP